MKISVLIPVYKGTESLEGLLSSLLEDSYRRKEILVCVDEPTPQTKKLIKKYKRYVKFFVNDKRIGKFTL
ncbi:MAG: glycosyltransferase [Candidatus Aenigmarchaeota archaeon]|nr:glycosyltransferase [Candidatus Aenigmarchaeota archaeon]